MSFVNKDYSIVSIVNGDDGASFDRAVADILNSSVTNIPFRPEGFVELQQAAEKYFFAQRHRFNTVEIKP